VAHGKIKLK